MKVAIVHYWLVNMRGGEKVLQALCELFPQADIYTHAYVPDTVGNAFVDHSIITSFIQKLPFSRKYYQNYLPLMPMALKSLDLSGYDLVISSESGPAKGVRTDPATLHVCYCHTPMRYAWDMYDEYRSSAPWLKRMLMPPIMHYMRRWDVASAGNVDHFVANSRFVAGRINRYYGRDADVINPPVNVDDFLVNDSPDDFYLLLGQLVTYKRADLAVDAFNQSGRKLVVIGEGEQLDQLKRKAMDNVRVLGRQSFSVIRDHLSRCRALIFPGVEDFGIVPVEAMASGRPVIAYRSGGALETVKEGVTGCFFDQQTVESLNGAVDAFESGPAFDSLTIAKHAQIFSKSVFMHRFSALIERLLS